MKEKTSDLIYKLDNYLKLIRYKYTELEKLSRLQILNDYYNSKKNEIGSEKLSSIVECGEQLKKGAFKLPLKVKGVFLTEGRPLAKFYTSEELEKSVVNPLNNSFPLMLDHKDTEAGKIIGQVTQIEYDDSIKGIRWWGHINSDTFARNVLDGSIKEVSATIYSIADYDELLGLVGKDLTYKELSLVMQGQEPNNSIMVDN